MSQKVGAIGPGRPRCLGEDEALALLSTGSVDLEAARLLSHVEVCSSCRRLVGVAASERVGGAARSRALYTLAAGERLSDRYEIVRLLARGGMGEVYETRDHLLGEVVALKTIVLAALDNQRALAALKAEVQLARKVSHRNVCRLLEFGIHTAGGAGSGEALPFFTMELLRGETLRARLRRASPLGIAETLPIVSQVIEGLEAIHAAGIVHRDLKPENVFLLEERQGLRAVVMDFGLARPLELLTQSFASSFLDLDDNSRPAGTLEYMSPEQLRGAPPTPSFDVYALGTIMFEMLSGSRPFGQGGAATWAATLARLDGPFPLLTRVLKDADPIWGRVIDRCLARDPDKRYQSVAEVREALLAAGSSRAEPPPTTATPLLVRPLSAEQRVASVVALRLRSGASARQAPAAVQRIVESFDGTVTRLGGGSFVATFRGAGTPADAVSAAARCALSLRKQMPEAVLAIGTGRVVGGTSGAGDAATRATALLRRRPRGFIGLDKTSAALLDPRFEVLAGETPVLIREIDRADRPRTVLGKEIPCIGRDREVSTMMSIWHECAAVPVARAVLVTAVAGGGKSRVRHELLERIALTGATFDLLVGRGDALRAGAPFTMLGPALRNASGLVGGESPEIARRHLFAHVRRHVPADRAGRVAAFLGEIADVPFPDDDLPALKAARQDPRLMADQTLAAWLDYLEAGCQVNPVLLVLEDLHWGDAPSVHFVDVALRTLRERPLMMLALARPEVDERFPNLWLERDLQRITLPPLTAKAAHRLVHAAAADVSDQQCAWIIERAHGNPFYLEELLRAVAAGAGTGTFPETIIGMVQARFDALGPDAKRVLRAAAIFGQTFHTAAARHLLGGDPELGLDHWLDLLVQKEVLFSRQTADTRELAFRHALMQEAAYDMLTAEDRALGHRLAGEYLEGAGEREAMLLVEHFERGGRPGKAAHWCRLAAEQALDANDLSAVIERVQRSVRCGAEGELLGTVRLLEAQARFWRGEFAAAESTARDAVINSSGNLRFTAIGELIAALGQQARFTEVTTWFHQLESSTGVDELPARLGSLIRAAGYLLPAGRYDLTDQLLPRLEELRPAMEPRHRARLDSVKGMLALHRGPQSDAIAAFRSALAVYESLGDQRSAAETLGNVAGSLADMGAFEEAERLLTSALSAAEKLDLRFVIAHVLTSLTYVHANLGQYQAARDSGERARLLAREQGDRRVEGAASIYLATAASAAGLHAAAEAHAREAITVVRDLRAILPAAVTALSRALLAQGRHREALDLSESAYRDLDSMGAVEEGEAWIYLTYAQCLAQDGQRSRAREVIARARARIMERSEAIDLPEWREAFLARRPEHAATLSLAAELLDREGGP